MPFQALDQLRADFRYSRRAILAQPMVALLVVLTLGLGIGANIAIFNIANALLLRPLPAPHPEELVRLHAGDTQSDFGIFSYANYLDIRDRSTRLSGLAAHQNVSVSGRFEKEAENLEGELVTGNYFTVLGIPAALGRTLLPSDDERMEQGPVVVISHELWKRRFGSDPAIDKRKMSINGHVFSIAGVMPPTFHGSYSAFETDFWAPMSTHELVRPRGLDIHVRNWGWLFGTGRLKSGVTLEQAKGELDQITNDLRREYPRANKNLSFQLRPATALPEQLNAQLSRAIGFLALLAAAVLLVACANVAGILLSRFFARGREIAVRYSLGANRLRLMSQYLTESMMFSLLGGIAGYGIAAWIKDSMRLLIPPDWPSLSANIAFDARTILFAAVACLFTGLVSAIAPMLRINGLNLSTVLKNESFSGKKHSRLFGFFVAGQIGICTFLLIVAGLFVRSTQKSTSFNPGFQTQNLIVGTVDLNRQGFTEEEGREFLRVLRDNLASQPGITSASYSVVTPLGPGDEAMGYIIPGHVPPDGGQSFIISNNIVGMHYFETMGIPLLSGRDFDSRETKQGGKRSIVINETMARKFWGSENPVGASIEMEGEGPMEIIGVVRDIKYHSLGEEPTPYVYRSFGQNYLFPVTIAVRTASDVRGFLNTLKKQVELLNPDVALYDVMTFEDVRAQQLFPIRALSLLCSIFSLLALVLTAVGIYGVVSYAVRRRTYEIGVRMALGAKRQDILGMILRHALFLSIAGLVPGALFAAGVSQLLSSVLYGVGALDPASFLGASLLLVFVASMASLVPARRASQINPAVSLRYE